MNLAFGQNPDNSGTPKFLQNRQTNDVFAASPVGLAHNGSTIAESEAEDGYVFEGVVTVGVPKSADVDAGGLGLEYSAAGRRILARRTTRQFIFQE